MKNKNILWGLAFILLAVALGLDAFGYLGNIGMFKILCTALLILISIESIIHINFFGILIPLAFIAILYKPQLGITALTPLSIIGIAMLLSIGLSLIFNKTHFRCNIHHEHHHNAIINDDPSCDCTATFTSTIKYINSDNFISSNIDCTFGAASVYFDNATIQGDTAEIFVDLKFAGTELYIPKNWNVICAVYSSFGGIEERNNRAVKDGPTVTIKGNITFSGLTIYYI